MQSFKKAAAVIMGFLMFQVCLFFGINADAKKLTLQTRLNIQGDYYDNVTFERENPQEDYYTSVEPSLSLNYEAEQSNLNSKIWFGLGRYANETIEDQENQEYSLDGVFRLSHRLRFSGAVSYRKDSTQNAQILETGEIAAIQDRNYYSGRGGLFYSFSELTSVGINYDYLKREYGGEGSVDLYQHNISVYFNRNFNNGLDTLTFQPIYYHQTLDYGEMDYYSASIGWIHRFNERFQMHASVGGRYEEQEIYDFEGDGDGIIANISVQRKYDRSTFELGYNRDLHREVLGGQTEVDRIFCQLDILAFPRLGMTFYGSFYYRQEPNGSTDNSGTYFEVKPSVYFKLTEKHVLELGYSYANSYDSALAEERTVDRNTVWLGIKLMYDKLW